MPPPDTSPQAAAPARWAMPAFDRAQLERSVRFTVAVMAPIVVDTAIGLQQWLVYAMVSAIVAFAGDSGGPPLQRLAWMAVGPVALSLGLLLGTMTLGQLPLVLVLSMAAGLAYGLVENAHPHLLLATRFFAFGIALAGLVSVPVPIDYVAIAVMLAFTWLLSLLPDLFRPAWSPLTAPPFAAILPSLSRDWRDRWTFGAAVSLAMGAALLATTMLGSLRPSWACLTILLVMRSEIFDSLQLAAESIAGTFGGVIVAAWIAHFGNHRLTLVVMAVAAFVRWPAQQLYNALGVFCLTAFVLLMVEIVTPDARRAAVLLHERLYDTLIGAVAAALGLLLYRLLRAGEKAAEAPGGPVPPGGS